MPSIASHFVVAKKVGEILNNNTDDFMIGNILPDIINLKDSHFKIKGKYYYVPDINRFINSQSYNKDVLIGCITHLLLDKYFLEEYIPRNIKDYQNFNLFDEDAIYEDYSRINYSLVKDFSLDPNYICYIMLNNDYDLDKDKVLKNISNIKREKIKRTKYINYENFKKFLSDISITIAKDIDNLLD